MSIRTIRGLGALIAAGGIVWGLAWIVSPSRQGVNSQVEIWASGVFQAGLLALLAVMWVTAATGTGRAARGVLAAEVVAVILAVAWTVPFLFDANRPHTGVLVVLDAFWPLSMAGLLVVGVMVARAGRWPGLLRYLPLVAALLIPVDLAVAWTPERVRDVVMGVYLALSYGATGAAMVRQADRLTAAGRAADTTSVVGTSTAATTRSDSSVPTRSPTKPSTGGPARKAP